MPNNRQWAFIFWLAVLAIWALSKPDVRSSMRSVLRAALSAKILMPLALLAAWVLGLVVLGSQIGLWTASRVTDTALWFVTAGLVLFGRFDRVSKDRRFVRRTALATFEISALVQVASEFFVLDLALELLTQPVFALLAMMSVVAAQQREHHQVRAVVDGVMTCAGIGLLLYVSVSLINNWDSLDKGDLAQQLALPIWLTIGVLPFIYVLGLFAVYELAFVRIDWKSKAGRWARMQQKAALLASFHMKATEIGAFAGSWQFRLAEAVSFRAARHVIADFRQAQLDAARDAQER
jgi:prepilin signal peptidase PulO-like enzyme (type II secretory pathway)